MVTAWCGRAASATALSQLLAADRSVPVPVWLRQLPFALRTHPPLRLRHWWIRTAPWAEAG
ncbi:hypothetical protein BN159_8399 [Streptomyces davaonensis JCM 4913]|uniref:Uncharacterized protein n=1 Tax=Streptomyces davaonensis (strain DSM 101723 / JCM 4913 / KCC S-0913 / 768) TaxID=1214101 RepID=K4RGC3_STRDJ|nr:hypothetical protein [Streptomyces davaonensis]CCK32777.1 hypothetical protein BN159_8399 [Streptomyces davaonensis JCM 4913]